MFEELLENPLMGINITDGEGHVLFLNKAHRRITGQSPEEYLGRTMKEIADDGLVSKSATVLVLETKEPVSINQVTSRRNHYFQVYATPLMDNNGEIRYVINYLIDSSDIVTLKHKIAEMNKLHEDFSSRRAWTQAYLNRTGELIYTSKVMQDVVEASLRVAEYEVSALITGPSGVGKEVVANLIHSRSSRSDAPFVKINCAAIPDHLLESELFGYEPGAFTGGNPKGKKGLIESSNTGTLLLDEIGELPLNLQSKLLRVLQTHSLRHIGGHEDIHVDFRLISSTNADLRKMIQQKTFREDLYYRINVVEIRIPPLEERREDIPPLSNFFLKQANDKYRTDKRFHPYALHYLSSCNYPGNVRELQNVIERAIIMSNGRVITRDDLEKAFGTPQTESSDIGSPANGSAGAFPAQTAEGFPDPAVSAANDLSRNTGLSLKELTARYEKEVLRACYQKYGSGVKVAKALKTDQSTISRKLHRYHLNSK